MYAKEHWSPLAKAEAGQGITVRVVIAVCARECRG
jgi:hypothetical protein